MNETLQAPKYVFFNERLCTGCAECVKACPTRALRIREKRHVCMVDRCIGCGECIRCCPTGAVRSNVEQQEAFDRDKNLVALVSPVLYAQFPGIMPDDVLSALKRIGFHSTIDLSYYIEMVQMAVETYIERHRNLQKARRPLISSVCPVVIRLIAFRFPNLLPHVIPIKRPVVLAASEIKGEGGIDLKTGGKQTFLYHITPCPSKIISTGGESLPEKPYIERALGINAVYPRLQREIEKMMQEDSTSLAPQASGATPSGRSLVWGVSGGEISGMNLERSLAVSGIKDTIHYLEKMEIGLFRDMEYIEFRTCPEGCIGGPLTALDKYIAKSAVHQMTRRYGFGRRLPRSKVLRRYEKGWFFSDDAILRQKTTYATERKTLSLASMQEIDRILQTIQGRNCAGCGAPNCRTFAEDVVIGKASLEDCLLIRARKAGDGLKKEPKRQRKAET